MTRLKLRYKRRIVCLNFIFNFPGYIESIIKPVEIGKDISQPKIKIIIIDKLLGEYEIELLKNSNNYAMIENNIIKPEYETNSLIKLFKEKENS